LNIIISKLENLSTNRSDDQPRDHQVTKVKWKYIRVKRCLDEAIEILASWQKIFDPSWFLIMKISSFFIDKELSRDGSAVSLFSGVLRAATGVGHVIDGSTAYSYYLGNGGPASSYIDMGNLPVCLVSAVRQTPDPSGTCPAE
jgi:hypothetical protein